MGSDTKKHLRNQIDLFSTPLNCSSTHTLTEREREIPAIQTDRQTDRQTDKDTTHTITHTHKCTLKQLLSYDVIISLNSFFRIKHQYLLL